VIGTTVGHFRIEKKIGAGGMGEVYRARDTKLGRDVALKLLPETSPDKLARFEREARAVAGLAHPNIVVVYAIEEFDGRHFIVLELIEGQDLSEVIVAKGLPLARVLELAVPLADALASAHERGVVHRDLKPSNIKLARDGRLKVLDFGLARMLDPDLQQTLDAPISGAGLVLGTIPYMAPEQLRGEATDARTDLFAFGVIVFELATGRRPFGGSNLMDVSSAILRDPAPSLTDVRAEMPEALGRIVGRCLAKDPRERFQTALDVANELRRISAGKPAPAARPADEVSIAVLPFANRSANPEDEYFAEGLADELLGVLAQIRGLRVAARTSSGRFKGTSEDLTTIGEKLNVATLLEGSVRKSGNRVRIGVQLVRVADGDAVWSRTYDRTLDDVFAVQDDIAHSVVKELRTHLLGEAEDSDASREAKAEVARVAAKGRSDNPQAQQLMLQARFLGERRSPGDTDQALKFAEEAVRLDPSFAAAWTELSKRHYSFVTFALKDAKAHEASAWTAIERALELDPEFAQAHSQVSWMRMGRLEFAAADEAVARAVRLDPNDPKILTMAGNLAMTHGRLAEAVALFERVAASDPLALVPLFNLTFCRFGVGRFDEALDAAERAAALYPESTGVHSHRALALMYLGRFDDALIAAELEKEQGLRLWALALCLNAAGRSEESDQAVERLIREHERDFAAQIAHVFAARGEIDRAFT